MELIILFKDQSESYVLGVEYGRLLDRFEKGIEIVENNGFPVHLKNKDVIISTCIRYNYTPFFGEEYYSEWIDFKAIKNNSFN